MKKIIIALVLATVLVTGVAFADHPGGFGIGVQSGYPFGYSLSLKLPSMPVYWAIDMWTGYDSLALSLTGDVYCFFDSRITGWLNWYLGLGGFAFVELGDPLGLAAGARLPIGLSFQIPIGSGLSCIELYLQGAPTIGLAILPGIGLWGDFFNAAGGLRLWFN